MKSEFESSHPIRWLNPEQVKAYDDEGNEISIPKCEMCGVNKCKIIGKTHCAWVCMNGCVKNEK